MIEQPTIIIQIQTVGMGPVHKHVVGLNMFAGTAQCLYNSAYK